MAQLNQGFVTEGTVYFAWQQTAGKGQRGKAWETAPGENIMLSIVLQPAMLALSEQFLLSASMALALQDFFYPLAGKEVCIKWSNDLYWRDRKAGGILIENVLRGTTWQYAVVGIGININQSVFPPHLPNPVSLKQITGKEWEINTLIRRLCNCVEQRYLQLNRQQAGQILSEYTQSLFRLHTPAFYKIGDRRVKACIKGVQPDGKLLLQSGPQQWCLDVGEVTFEI